MMSYHYYRVKTGDTLVFPVYLLCWPAASHRAVGALYQLLSPDEPFTDYPDLVAALKKAKLRRTSTSIGSSARVRQDCMNYYHTGSTVMKTSTLT